MRHRLLVILLTLVSMLSSSCENSCNVGREIRIITGSRWEVRRYIDYYVNQENSMVPEVYEFYTDGAMMKISGNDTLYSKWSIPECNYMTVGGKTFKIAELSRKIMVLRYGYLDFYYYPCQ